MINLLLTITVFPNIVIYYYNRESGRGRNMLQSFSLSFCLLSVVLVRCLVVRGFFGRRLTLSVLETWYQADPCSVFMASSRPGFPVDPSHPVPYCTGLFLTRGTSVTASWRTGDQADSSSVLRHILVQAVQPFLSNAFSSRAIAEPSPASVLVPLFGIFVHSERLLDGAACFFHWHIFVTDLWSAQVMSLVNIWPLQRTHAREKLFVPGGNWSPSCESDVLPLDHGLPLFWKNWLHYQL